jgi:pimeloyl-ACP methyl ester carboxylesterase
LLALQHFTGTLDNWDPAMTDPLAADRDIILFDNAGVGGSTGKVLTTMAGMSKQRVLPGIGVGQRDEDRQSRG